MTISVRIALPFALLLVGGCTVVPPLEPIQKKPKITAQSAPRFVKMTLAEAIGRYAPADYPIPDDANAAMSTVITLDTTLPWQRALDEAIADAGIVLPAQDGAADSNIRKVTANDGATPQAHPILETSSEKKAALPAPSKETVAVQTDQLKPEVAVPPLPVWEAKPQASVRETLQRWCHDAGWDLSWNYKDLQTGEMRDLTLGGGLSYQGSFNDAVKEFFNSFPTHIKIQADLWSGNNPPLLHVYNDGTDK